MYSNYLFLFIIYSQYPGLVITEQGLYLFVDIPKLVPWDDIKDYKWAKVLNKYHLELCKNTKYKKIHRNFPISDKIIIDFIIRDRKFKL